MAFQEAADVSQLGKACRVAFGEAVFGKTFHLFAQRFDKSRVVAPLDDHRMHQALLMLREIPLRFQAAMSRRRRSASSAVKSPAFMAISITCSWKIGTPSVRSSTAFTSGPG